MMKNIPITLVFAFAALKNGAFANPAPMPKPAPQLPPDFTIINPITMFTPPMLPMSTPTLPSVSLPTSQFTESLSSVLSTDTLSVSIPSLPPVSMRTIATTFTGLPTSVLSMNTPPISVPTFPSISSITIPTNSGFVTPTPLTSSSQKENSSSTSISLAKPPLPTVISTNPLETQINQISTSMQKTLNSSLNDQGTKLTVQVTSTGSGQDFRGDFNLQTEGTPHAGATFYRHQNDTEPFFKFRVGLLKFVELNPAANWHLASSDNAINFASLPPSNWSTITITDVPNNQSVAIKSISTTFSSLNTTVTFEAYMVNDTVKLDNVTHTPKSLKYSLRISNFPFRYNNSQLAIVKGVYFKKGDEAITLDSAASVLFTDSSIKVEDVPNTNPPESVAYVVFKIPNSKFKNLVWDPEVILEEEKMVESYNQTSAKNDVEKLFSSASSLVVVTLVSMAMIFLNGI
ncbi:hypothetical protein BKA69DRAFT_1102440 [Paraphysoderma sedebokerense]|nr:hypothetical protein BKA69DRAFT_1102440 [Paraphysoderma sedebokerense]